jgi:glutaredoxin
MEKEDSTEKSRANSQTAEERELVAQKEYRGETLKEMKSLNVSEDSPKLNNDSLQDVLCDKMDGSKGQEEKMDEDRVLQSKPQEQKLENDIFQAEFGGKMNESTDLGDKMDQNRDLDSKAQEATDQTIEEDFGEEKEEEPVFDGTEVPEMEASRSTSTRSLDLDPETQGVVEKAVALKNFVKEKSAVAVSSVLRRLSGKKDEEGPDVPDEENKDVLDSIENSDGKEVPEKTMERSAWNPLSYIVHDTDADNKAGQRVENIEGSAQPIATKGRIILYTRLGCPDCKEARLFLYWKRLRYVEINIDIYPSRKLELEKISGSSAVPKVFFNEILIGGLSELKALNESGKIDDKIEYLINEAPSCEAPLPPLSGEDDLSSSGAIDELALIVRKMKESIIVKDRFYKIRRFTSCFQGSEAVDFLSEDQYLEREEVC